MLCHDCGYGEVFEKDVLHVAFVGRACCGKSSLVNAVRFIADSDKSHAAPVSVTRQVLPKPKDYSYPGEPRLKIWDVGAYEGGNAHKYYRQQMLSRFDVIFIVIDITVHEFDRQILLKKPRHQRVVFVQSKMDSHIENQMLKSAEKLTSREAATQLKTGALAALETALVIDDYSNPDLYMVSADRFTDASCYSRIDDTLDVLDEASIFSVMRQQAVKKCGDPFPSAVIPY